MAHIWPIGHDVSHRHGVMVHGHVLCLVQCFIGSFICVTVSCIELSGSSLVSLVLAFVALVLAFVALVFALVAPVLALASLAPP